MLRFVTALFFVFQVVRADQADFQWEDLKDFGQDPVEHFKHCAYDGKSMESLCHARVEKKYGPKFDAVDPNAQTWERCCSYFAELNCYWMENKYYCKDEVKTQDANNHFIRVNGFFLENSICGLIRFIGGQPSCTKSNYLAGAAYFNKTGHTGEFVRMPLAQNDHTRSCFKKLEKKDDSVKQCVKQALDIYDKERRKVYESTVHDACCAEYSILDCLKNSVEKTCSGEEKAAFKNYHDKSLKAFSHSICKAVPNSLCSKKH